MIRSRLRSRAEKKISFSVARLMGSSFRRWWAKLLRVKMYCFAPGLSNVKGARQGTEWHNNFTAKPKAEYAVHTPVGGVQHANEIYRPTGGCVVTVQRSRHQRPCFFSDEEGGFEHAESGRHGSGFHPQV